jgi:hypothetical protein
MHLHTVGAYRRRYCQCVSSAVVDDRVRFDRERDPESGHDELVIRPPEA